MVLPPPAAPAQSAPGVSGWIEEIRQGLRLSPAGVLILVDHAVLEKLGGLVRALLADYPELDVFTEVAELSQASDGAVVVFLPKASDAEWLNLNRPMFARKALKVVLFCEREVSEALSRRAPDFFDWISQRQECPQGAAEHAIWGIRKALCARAPGIIFFFDQNIKNRTEHVERVFQEALPGRRLLWLKPNKPNYDELVRQIRNADRAWVACDSAGYEEAECFRWALAEAGRRTRALLLLPNFFDDRFWIISDQILTPFSSASALLAEAGAKHPGRLAAAAGLEPLVIAALTELLGRAHNEETLLRAMHRSPDPGAALAETILAAGIERNPLQGRFMSPPVQRHLGKFTGLRRKFPSGVNSPVRKWAFEFEVYGKLSALMSDRAAQIEILLSERRKTAERWVELARLALDEGHADVAVTWAERALALQTPRQSETYLLHGLALAMLGREKWKRGAPTKMILQQAEGSLRRAEETMAPSAPPEDVLSLHAHRAEILMNLGQVSEAEWPLRKALQLIDTPLARVKDIERIAETLRRKGRRARAEELLKSALEKATAPADVARAKLMMGWSAYRAGRISDAHLIAEDLSQESDWAMSDADWEIGGSSNTLRVRTRIARNEFKEALALADTELSRAAAQWGPDAPRTLFWVPAIALSLNHVGRARDAEVVIRKALGLPLEIDVDTFALGLSSRSALLSILAIPRSPQMDPRTRRELWNELVRALRAQGRHVEANAMELRRDKDALETS